MPRQTTNNIPHLVIVESPANDLYLLIDSVMNVGSHLVRQAIAELVAEGKKLQHTTANGGFHNVIASELLQDEGQRERFLARIESLLKHEPDLQALAEVVSKFLSQIKALAGGPVHSTVRSSKKGARRELDGARADELVHCLLGLLSLMLKALSPAETSNPPLAIHLASNGTEKVADSPPPEVKKARPRRAVSRSRSSLLR